MAHPQSFRRVLVVDDEPDIRAFLASILRRAGLPVREAENGSAAYALFSSAPTEFDLLITDIVMPEMDGIELGAKIKAQFPDFPILYISGFADQAPPKRRNTKFLRKPFTPAQIRKALEQLLPLAENE